MHLAGVTRGAMMKRQGKIRISVREAFIHQTAPIEEGSDDNGKCVAILRQGGGDFHITVALTKCAGCKLVVHRSAPTCISDARSNDWTAYHNRYAAFIQTHTFKSYN